MKILFAASEAVPFAKTGGLADVAGSLPPALAGLGHDVRLIIPRYRVVGTKHYGLKQVASFFVPVGSWRERCTVFQCRLGKNATAYFVDRDVYFDRAELYQTRHGDYADNALRFTYFSRAVLELCRTLEFAPDIVHGNDWQTGLVPFFLRTFYARERIFRGTKSIFTVHNLGYQGTFWHWDMRYLGDAWEHYTSEGLEFWNRISFLKAGLVYSDIITTVSRTYSREIQTPEYGHGLEGVLAKRASDLFGIVNGIDYSYWNPAKNRVISKRYTPAAPAGKAACKRELLRELDLPAGSPLIGMVTRLADQKGLDILIEALPEIMSLGAQLVILGTGEERYESVLTRAAERYPDRIKLVLIYDEMLAKRIYAGSDLFLMPSRYEPCGLGQLIALRYGAVPLVRKTGGLADTVRDFSSRSGRGTGFVFKDYSAPALIRALRRAIAVYREAGRWKRLVRTCMEQDFSWEHSAKGYEKVYRKALKKK